MKRQQILIAYFMIFFPAFFSGCATIPIPKYHSIEVNKTSLNFYILNDEVDKERPYPVIISIGGSEVYSRVGLKKGMFSTSLAGSLALKYFGYYDFKYLTIAPEKRNIPEGYIGNEAPDNFHETNSLEQSVKDTEAVISHILKNYNIDRQKVILLSGSEGGAVATMVARKNRSITHLIIHSAGGWSHEDEMKYSIKNSIPGHWNKDLKELQSLDSFNKFLLELKSNSDSLDKWWYGWPYKYWASFMFYRPVDDLRMVKIPILIQIGDRNYDAGLKGAKDVKRVFDNSGKPNLTLRIYRGLDHVFKDEKGVSHAKEIFEDFYGWLEKN